MNPKPFSSLNHLTVPFGMARHRTSRGGSVHSRVAERPGVSR
jgi:hypothetical protein